MKRIIKRWLQITNLYGIVVCVEYLKEKVYEKLLASKIKKTANIVNDLVLKKCNGDISKIIYIFQYSYYTQDGQKYISGGGERYATDLGEIIFSLSFFPILIQLGEKSADVPWKLEHNNLTVIGLNADQSLYRIICRKILKPKLAIYSGFVNFGHDIFSPNIMISHGITWDNPMFNVDTWRILGILKPINKLVSVDTNTISWLRSSYANYLSVHKKEMIYIPNYVDLNNYHIKMVSNDDDIKIVFPRRLSPERGFWLILEVLPQILDKYSNISFDFVGFIHTKDIENALSKLMNKYKGRIKHYFVNANEMHKVYEQTDITLIPTLYSEGTSLSCIEAMACGNAVIATNIGGLPNLIINDFNGILINPEKAELLNAIEKTVTDAAYRKKLGANARMVAMEFSKEKWDEQWKGTLTEALR